MDDEKAYQETLDYLYSFIDYSLQKSFRYSPEKFDLARMHVFLESLGDPQSDYPILHVAGTKGKGSVSALCAQALQESGYRVGLYTSPHLQDYVERIQVNGTPISHTELVSLVEEIKPLVAAVPELTTFEITTALAFLHFSRQEVNAAVVEVGLGGRLDATNVCTPEVTVITSISYDHTYLLGETLAEIAAEKAGIIKAGIPVVVSPQPDEAREVIEQIAAERGAPLIQVGWDYLFKPLSSCLENQTLQVWQNPDIPPEQAQELAGDGGKQAPVNLTIPLLGAHQVENAATAYATLQVAHKNGLAVSKDAIRQGFVSTYWPGRFEILRRSPPLIIDSAHNRDSAQKLSLTLEEYYPGSPVILVFGASEDKDIEGMYTELLPRVRQVVATKSTHPRAFDPHELAQIARKLGLPAVSFSTIEEALAQAELYAEGSAVILVTGSIFVAAAAREVLRERLTVEDSA